MADFLERISGTTDEELERISIPVPLDDEGSVVLSPDDWIEENGIRYLKKPLLVDCVLWGMYTMDCCSLFSRVHEPNTLCILAFSVSEEATNYLGDVFFEEQLGTRGFGFFFGFSSEEVL